MSCWRLTTLGRYSLSCDGVIVPAPATLKARALLVYLALHREGDVARERLLDLLWPAADPDRARANLKTATWSLRRAFRSVDIDPDSVLTIGRATLRWIAPIAIDLDALYAAQTASSTTSGQIATACYVGDFLEGDYDEWVVAERERAAAACESLLRRLVRGGDEAAARALLERDPYDEGAHAVAIAAAESRGDRKEVLRLRERFATACEELGIAAPLAPVAATPKTVIIEQEPPIDTLIAPPLRFAGREREIANVRAAIERVEGGRGAVAAFVGDAGIGKTTLLERARAFANDKNLRVVSVAGLEADPRAYGPWEVLFESLLGAPFARFAAASGAGAAERLALELVEALRALERRCAILIDDAHLFAGEAATVLLAVVATAVANGAVVVVAARPQGSAFVRRLAAFGGGTVAEIGPLDEVAARAALAPFRGLEPEVATLLHRRSGGHPLYFAGLVELLARTGTLRRTAEGWRTSPIEEASLVLPETLAATLDGQLRSRGEAAVTAACALALEPEADAALLARACGFDEATLADALDDLIAIRAVVQPTSGPAFAFAHDALAEVALGLLNRARRAKLHRAFATAFSAARVRGSSLRAARHFERCGDPIAAAESFAAAARESLEWFAPLGAAAHTEAGRAALRTLGDAGDHDGLRAHALLSSRLDLLLARAHVLEGADSRARGPVAHAVHAARIASDPRVLADALALDAAVALNCHRIDGAITSAREAVELAQSNADLVAAARAAISLSHAMAHAGTLEDACEAAESAAEFGARSGDASAEAAALDALVRAQIMWWRFADAADTARRQRAAARRAGWLPEAAAFGTSALLWYYCGAHDRALAELDQAFAIVSDDAGERRWTIAAAGLDRLKVRYFARYTAGVIALARGERAAAASVAAELDREHLTDTSPMIRNNVLHLWIDALLEAPARDDLRVARDLAARLMPDPYEQGSVLDLSGCRALALARIAALGGEASAPALLSEALRVVEQHARRTPLECDRAFARLAHAATIARETGIAAAAAARADALSARRARCSAAALEAAPSACRGFDFALTGRD